MHLRTIVLPALALCALVAALVVFGAGAVAAPADATYVGSAKCLMCHSGMHGNIVNGWKKSGHASSFADVSKTPEAIKGEFGDDAPITKEQIKYLLASGKGLQAFIGADMKTLPAEWSATESKWIRTSAVDAKTQCIGCHTGGYKIADASWVEPAVGCESCHGPGSAHAASGKRADLTDIKELPNDRKMMVCGHCHARGTDPSNAHAFPVNFKPGDDLSKLFKLAPVTKGAQNQQYNEILASKHPAAGVTCITCHEPHGAGTTQPAQLKKPVNDLCLGCHQDIKSVTDHMPQAASGATCATCHMPGGSHTFKAGI